MPVINGVYTKDFPALGRAPIDTDIIPIAEVANQITYKTTLGEIFNAKVFGTTGSIPKFTSGNTLGDSIITELSDKIGVDIATPNNKLSINSTDPGSGLDLQIGATSYARFGIINPGLPGEPGVDNDCFIGSTINNDFLIRTNNIEALRIDTAQRLKIANIQNALADTDKFLVSEDGVVKYRTGAEVLADIGGQGAIILTTSGSSGASTLTGNTLNIPNYSQDLSGFVTLNTVQTITAAKTFTTSGNTNTLTINHSSGSGLGLSITKGGNGEGIYVNKTSGSGNAVTIIGTLNATTLVKNGGTSSQFLKADGSVDSTAYGTGSVTSVSALTLGTSGTDLSSTVANSTTTPVITLNVPDASATARGVITTGSQTIAGTKTFSVDAVVNGITVGHGGSNLGSNTVVGFESLFSNTTGESNTATGIQTLFSNTTGIYNSGFGAYSLVNNTTGSSNSSLGYNSLYTNTTGIGNTAFGSSSLYNNTISANNTGIGFQALFHNTTGYSNIGLGNGAGMLINSGASNQTSTNSVYLGNDTRASANGNSNEIVIGDSARGGGSNSATLGNSSIAKTNLKGKVGINYTTNPSLYDLDVNGTGRFAALTTSGNNIFNNTSGRAIDAVSTGVLFAQNGGAHNIIFGDGNVRYFSLYTPSGAASMSIRNFSTSTDLLTIASTGAATFSSSVTSKQSNISADGAGVVLQGYVDNTLRIAVRGSGYNDGGRGGLLASTGDFSSSVSATQGKFTAPTTSLTDLAGSFGAVGYESGIYMSGINNINSMYNTNGNNGLNINYVGYLGGTTQFRDFNIWNGKQGAIASFIGATGNVGIGTTTPLSKLHVNGTFQVGFVDTSNTAMEFYWNGSSSYGRIQTYSSSALSLNPLGNNVLIGTTTDNGAKLQVNGGINSTNGRYGTGVTFAITALNTNTLIINTPYSGLIVIRDNTNGGSAVWLGDPNMGFIQIANNMPGTFSMSYITGSTYIQKNSGSVPCNYSVGFYSNSVATV